MDPYSILGVAHTATQDEIKAAYRKKAKKLHPDLNPGNKKTENEFKEVNKAYELIGEPEARAKFAQFNRRETQEQQEQAWREHQSRQQRRGPYFYETQEAPPGGRYSQSFEGIDPEMFANIFGGGGRFGNQKRSHDQNYSMEVDFKTAVLGGEKEIQLPTGKALRVKIPPGIRSGTKLRLAGKAEDNAGDVYIEVTILPSAIFKRVGEDLEMELAVSLSEAVLGAEIKTPTIDGSVMLKIPSGVTTGSKLRIRGKGVPSGSSRGDQFVTVKIVMPKNIDTQLKDAIQDWSKTHNYNPREDHHG